MEIRNAVSPTDARYYTTQKLREEFLIQKIFVPDDVTMVYSHVDRIITGGLMPIEKSLCLPGAEELHAEFFLERREMGIINIGGKGIICVDGKKYPLENRDGMYVGKGKKKILFESAEKENPAKFYFNSTPAHRTCPTVLIMKDKKSLPEGLEAEDAVTIKAENMVELGSSSESNHRVICKYILPGQVESCQLVMGLTALMEGSVWNTMPCHTHDRRMEVYLYFDVREDAFVVHYMGEPDETRHLIVRNEQAVISPGWSIHSGCGTGAYTFIWGMAGENQDFSDMDAVAMKDFM